MRLIVSILCVSAFILGFAAGQASAQEPAPVPPVAEKVPQVKMVPKAKFVKAVKQRRAADKRIRALKRTIRNGPDFQVSLQLAAISYGQDWRWMRRCALSEGYGVSRRYHRNNLVTNREGSGATSTFQFMRGTFLSTPFRHLDWTRQDVQAHAAAWMWANGRRGEWAGHGCR